MAGSHTELRFEQAIEAHLLGHGWISGTASNYRPAVGLDTAELFTFLGATQPTEWGGSEGCMAVLMWLSASSPSDLQRRSASAARSMCSAEELLTSVCGSSWPTSDRPTRSHLIC